MYTFKELELSNGEKILTIIFDDEKLEILSAFLSTEVSTFHEAIIQTINNVLSEEVSFDEFHGNAYGIEIKKEKTLVLDELADDGFGDCVEINTSELLNLILIWINKAEELKIKRYPSQNETTL